MNTTCFSYRLCLPTSETGPRPGLESSADVRPSTYLPLQSCLIGPRTTCMERRPIREVAFIRKPGLSPQGVSISSLGGQVRCPREIWRGPTTPGAKRPECFRPRPANIGEQVGRPRQSITQEPLHPQRQLLHNLARLLKGKVSNGGREDVR